MPTLKNHLLSLADSVLQSSECIYT
jgi:hypothetical protein